jgi:ADP-ribose pyrophosphatase YjhB (NUDIX family)
MVGAVITIGLLLLIVFFSLYGILTQNKPYEKVMGTGTLCYLRRGREILLAWKTRNIGMGCLNGYGGGTENEETYEEGVLREVLEESGVVGLPKHLNKIAVIYFHNQKRDGTMFICEIHAYELTQWEGEITGTEEMVNPTWFALDELPIEHMMPGDPDWLIPALHGEKIVAHVYYGPFQKELLRASSIEKVDHF